MPDSVSVGDAITPELQDAFRIMEIRAKHSEFNANVLGDVISYLDDHYGFESDVWRDVVKALADNDRSEYEIEDVLTTFCDVDESVFYREFVLDVTIPVYFSMSVYARDADAAHDTAYNEIQNMWHRDILNSFDTDVDSSGLEITNVAEV